MGYGNNADTVGESIGEKSIPLFRLLGHCLQLLPEGWASPKNVDSELKQLHSV
jgi:hypothetical protein